MLEGARRKRATEVAFVQPAEQVLGQVDEVDDFSGWTPGGHQLTMRLVRVALPAQVRLRVRFRCLARGDHFFEDQHADAHHATGRYRYTRPRTSARHE